MTYRKHLNTKEVNQLLEERFFNKKTLKDPIVESKNQDIKKDDRVIDCNSKTKSKIWNEIICSQKKKLYKIQNNHLKL
jgi:hypothetical protein